MRPTGRPRPHDHRRRLALLSVFIAFGFCGVIAQLVYLQIFTGDRLAELSEKNRIRLRTVTAPRGILFDRNGQPLVENRPAFTLAVVPRDAEDLPAVLERLASLLGLPAAELHERFAKVPHDSPWPVRLSRGLTLDEVARIEE
jgi:penicillin-binding protein 2